MRPIYQISAGSSESTVNKIMNRPFKRPRGEFNSTYKTTFPTYYGR